MEKYIKSDPFIKAFFKLIGRFFFITFLIITIFISYCAGELSWIYVFNESGRDSGAPILIAIVLWIIQMGFAIYYLENTSYFEDFKDWTKTL